MDEIDCVPRSDGSIVVEGDTVLSEEDIKFLKSIQLVNDDPEKYAESGDKEGVTPATIERTSRVAQVESYKIRYWMRSQEFTEAGYVIEHPVPDDVEKGMGARSFELTTQGREVVRVASERNSDPIQPGIYTEELPDEDLLDPQTVADPVESLLEVRKEVHEVAAECDGDSEDGTSEAPEDLIEIVDRWFVLAAAEFQRTRRRINSLESEIEELQSAVGQLQGQADNRFGMWDQKEVEEYHASTEAIQGLRFVAHCGLGVDTERLIEDGDLPFSEQEIQRTRAEIVDTVASGSGGE